MNKKYFLIFFLSLTFLISHQGFSQSEVNQLSTSKKIEGLSIYPNPVEGGIQNIYISSKNNFTKKVEIYNVLGKQVFTKMLSGKELNISELSTGVYILKVTEKNISESRKLIIM